MFKFVRLHQHLISSYHATKLSFAYAGLVGVFVFYRAAVLFTGVEDYRILLILGLTPSVLFWGSILGKDPLTLLGVAIYSYGTVGICSRHRFLDLLWVGLGIALTTAIRSWMVAILSLPLAVAVFHMVRGSRKYVVAAVFVLAAPWLIRYVANAAIYVQAASLKEVIQEVAQRGRGFNTGNSATGRVIAITDWGDCFRYAPQSVFTILFRPFPGEVNNIFGLVAGLEDIVLLTLALRALVRFHLSDLRSPVIVWAIALVLTWALPYGLMVQNMGAAVRFRVEILPVFVLLMLYIGRSGDSITTISSRRQGAA